MCVIYFYLILEAMKDYEPSFSACKGLAPSLLFSTYLFHGTGKEVPVSGQVEVVLWLPLSSFLLQVPDQP